MHNPWRARSARERGCAGRGVAPGAPDSSSSTSTADAPCLDCAALTTRAGHGHASRAPGRAVEDVPSPRTPAHARKNGPGAARGVAALPVAARSQLDHRWVPGDTLRCGGSKRGSHSTPSGARRTPQACITSGHHFSGSLASYQATPACLMGWICGLAARLLACREQGARGGARVAWGRHPLTGLLNTAGRSRMVWTALHAW